MKTKTLPLLMSIVLTGTFFISLTDVSGQSGMSPERQRLSNIKISLIVSRLNLTQEQSIRFWPIYNEYTIQRRNIHKSIRQIVNYQKSPLVSNLKSTEDMNKVNRLKQTELQLDKQYQLRFLEIISVSQLNKLYLAEDAYRTMLLERLKR